MDTKSKIELANKILGSVDGNGIEVLSNDKGLIERSVTEKIILTKDNRELLTD